MSLLLEPTEFLLSLGQSRETVEGFCSAVSADFRSSVRGRYHVPSSFAELGEDAELVRVHLEMLAASYLVLSRPADDELAKGIRAKAKLAAAWVRRLAAGEIDIGLRPLPSEPARVGSVEMTIEDPELRRLLEEM